MLSGSATFLAHETASLDVTDKLLSASLVEGMDYKISYPGMEPDGGIGANAVEVHAANDIVGDFFLVHKERLFI